MSCLQQQDFTDFAAQLEGLASIYQLNAEKAVKCNALNALQSLEADLLTLSSLQIMDAQSMLCKSPVGILQKRRGGWIIFYLFIIFNMICTVDLTYYCN